MYQLVLPAENLFEAIHDGKYTEAMNVTREIQRKASPCYEFVLPISRLKQGSSLRDMHNTDVYRLKVENRNRLRPSAEDLFHQYEKNDSNESNLILMTVYFNNGLVVFGLRTGIPFDDEILVTQVKPKHAQLLVSFIHANMIAPVLNDVLKRPVSGLTDIIRARKVAIDSTGLYSPLVLKSIDSDNTATQ